MQQYGLETQLISQPIYHASSNDDLFSATNEIPFATEWYPNEEDEEKSVQINFETPVIVAGIKLSRSLLTNIEKLNIGNNWEPVTFNIVDTPHTFVDFDVVEPVQVKHMI